MNKASTSIYFGAVWLFLFSVALNAQKIESSQIPAKQKEALIEISHQYSDGFAVMYEESIQYKELSRDDNGKSLSIGSFTLEGFCMGNHNWYQFIVVFEKSCPGDRKPGRDYSCVGGVFPIYCPRSYGYYDLSKAQFDEAKGVIKIPSTEGNHPLRLEELFRWWIVDPTSVAPVPDY